MVYKVVSHVTLARMRSLPPSPLLLLQYLPKINGGYFPKSPRISHLHLSLPSGLFPSGSRTKIHMHSSSLPYVLHAMPISSSLAWSFYLYLAKEQIMKLHPPITYPSSVQMFSSTPHSQTPSMYVFPLILETKFHTSIEPRERWKLNTWLWKLLYLIA
jgi:hypothetical protein